MKFTTIYTKILNEFFSEMYSYSLFNTLIMHIINW